MINLNWTKEQVLQHLQEIEDEVRSAHTPLPYEFNLIKDIYDIMTKDFWAKYQQEHPHIIIRFFDRTAVYGLNDGELVIEGVY